MLQGKTYVPLLKAGIAEVGAYRNLYPDVKAATFPVFLLRPWPNANLLDLAVNRIREAVGGGPFGLGLDPSRRGHSSTKPAQQTFNGLYDEHRGFTEYYEFLNDITEAVPVLQSTRSSEALLLQIGNADRLDRGLIVHQTQNASMPLSSLILSMPPLPHDTVFIVDAGWSRDYVGLEAWTIPLAERIHQSGGNAEIVIMCSSFPESFGHIIGNAEELGSERRLFNAARQRLQQADLTFGDWGSTRPSQGGGGGKIPSRIDVPRYNSWHVFRANPASDGGFVGLAQDARQYDCYNLAPDCWGKQAIAITGEEGAGIISGKVATEVRINMHMTIQSGASSILPLDEVPYTD